MTGRWECWGSGMALGWEIQGRQGEVKLGSQPLRYNPEKGEEVMEVTQQGCDVVGCGAWKLLLGLLRKYRCPRTWAIFQFSRPISRQLDWEQSSWDMNQQLYGMAVLQMKLNLLCHGTGP